MSLRAVVFETGAGWCGLAWSEMGVRVFRLPSILIHPLQTAKPHPRLIFTGKPEHVILRLRLR